MGFIIPVFVLVCMVALKLTECLSESVFIFILLAVSSLGLVLSIYRLRENKTNLSIAELILNIVVFTLLVIIMITWPFGIAEESTCMINKIGDYVVDIFK
jgi:hypothetical protein